MTARAPAAPRARVWLALLALAVLACYAGSLRGPFLFDDLSLALESPISARNRPLVRASFALNRRLDPAGTLGYHLFNLGVHVAAGWVLFGLVRRTLARVPGASGVRAEPFAFAVALVWLVHPLQTESVAYISQRAESLAGLFLLATLYASARAAEGARAWQAAAFAALALGMATKEIAATAPALLLAYDWSFARGSPRAALARRWRFHALFAGATLALSAWFIGPLLFGAETSGFGVETVSPAAYARTQPGVILHYLALAFAPVGLCLDRMWPLADGLGEWLPQALVLAALGAATLWALARRAWPGFAGAWFFVTLAPTSSFVPIQDAAVEHRMYLPLAAVVVVALGALWALGARLWPARPAAPLAAALALAAALGVATVRRNALYADAEAMWSDVVAKAPHNWRAHLALGTVRLAAGRHAEAARDLERSLALSPRPNTYLELGRAYSRMGAHAEALRAFDAADRLRPLHAETLLDRGIARLRAGDPRAQDDLERSAALAPTPAAHYNLGVAALNGGDGARAERHFRRALELLPDSPQSLEGLARALLLQDRPQEARAPLERALQLAPGNAALTDLLRSAGG